MNLTELFMELSSHNVELSVVGGSIHCHPRQALTPPLITTLREQKPRVMNLIHRISDGKVLTATECLKAIQDKSMWEADLREALKRVASLYDAAIYEQLSPEKKQKLVECDESLDSTLVSPNGDYQSAIEEWEREWCLALGYHPIPREQLFRLQNWDEQKISAALQKGIPVKIWSVVLGEWIYWVRDNEVAEKTKAKYPDTSIYTLQELKIMTGARWTREYLQKMHLNKSVLGATLIESSRNDHGCE